MATTQISSERFGQGLFIQPTDNRDEFIVSDLAGRQGLFTITSDSDTLSGVVKGSIKECLSERQRQLLEKFASDLVRSRAKK